jgi:hypothetical protein
VGDLDDVGPIGVGREKVHVAEAGRTVNRIRPFDPGNVADADGATAVARTNVP